MSFSTRSYLLFFMVAILASLAFGLPAFATVGDAGYMTWSSFGGTNGTSPHGGYTNSTQKCVVCHAVHESLSGGQVLLASSVANACIYCHVDTLGAGYTQVYQGNPTNYSGADYANAHNSYSVASVERGVICTTCHQVHAAQSAMTANAYLTTKLLKGAKSYVAVPQPNYDPIAQAPQSTDATELALTKWCAGCHFTMNLAAGRSYSYYADAYDLPTHVMTTATASYGGSGTYSGRVAWDSSNYCSSCHESAFGTAEWPHFTPGLRFLTESTDVSGTVNGATDTEQDGVCLRCHRGGGGTTGIGRDF